MISIKQNELIGKKRNKRRKRKETKNSVQKKIYLKIGSKKIEGFLLDGIFQEIIVFKTIKI